MPDPCPKLLLLQASVLRFAAFCMLTFDPRKHYLLTEVEERVRAWLPSLYQVLTQAPFVMLVRRRMPCPVRYAVRCLSLKLVNQVMVRHQAWRVEQWFRGGDPHGQPPTPRTQRLVIPKQLHS